MNNITLIGMPGAGKSSIGVVLAKVLGYQFIDSDLLIQKEEKRTLSEIIEQDGIDGFKAVENRVNASIQVENTVIATGGSVVYCDEAASEIRRSCGISEDFSEAAVQASWQSERPWSCSERRADTGESL